LINRRTSFHKDLILKRVNIYPSDGEKQNGREVDFPPNQHMKCKICRKISSKDNTIDEDAKTA